MTSFMFWTSWPLHFPCHHSFVPFRHQFFNICFRNWWRLITTLLEIVGTFLYLRITELHFSWHTVIVFGSLIQHGATWLDCLCLLFKSLKVDSEFEKIYRKTTMAGFLQDTYFFSFGLFCWKLLFFGCTWLD